MVCNFMARMKQIRCMGGVDEENSYYQDKITIEIYEGKIRNPVKRKLVQRRGSIFYV